MRSRFLLSRSVLFHGFCLSSFLSSMLCSFYCCNILCFACLYTKNSVKGSWRRWWRREGEGRVREERKTWRTFWESENRGFSSWQGEGSLRTDNCKIHFPAISAAAVVAECFRFQNIFCMNWEPFALSPFFLYLLNWVYFRCIHLCNTLTASSFSEGITVTDIG